MIRSCWEEGEAREIPDSLPLMKMHGGEKQGRHEQRKSSLGRRSFIKGGGEIKGN